MNHAIRFFAVPLLCAAASLLSVDFAAAQSAPAPAPAQRQTRPAAAQPARPKPQTQATAPAAAPAIGGVQPILLGQFGDWGAYTANPGGKKVCFALAKPATSQTVPPNRPRDQAYMFVSSRPAEKVKDEVSVVIGYGFKPNTDANLEIAGAQYAMYTQSDGAWIKNAAEENRLVDAMRKAGDLTVKGTSARGTATVDIFSLKGLSQALDRVGQECR